MVFPARLRKIESRVKLLEQGMGVSAIGGYERHVKEINVHNH